MTAMSEGIEGLIERALRHPDVAVRVSACRGLSRAEGREVDDALVAALGDTDPGVRAAAAAASAARDDPDLLAALAGALGDGERDVRLGAARALAATDLGWTVDLPRNLVDGLGRALVDAASAVRRHAAAALGSLGDDRAVPALCTTLATETDISVRQAAVEALGTSSSEAAMTALRAALGDIDADVRAAAANALGRLGDRSSVQGLGESLLDLDADVRHAAAWALGELGHADVVRRSGIAASDSDSEVRAMAAMVLTRESGERGLDAFQIGPRGRSRTTRHPARRAVGVAAALVMVLVSAQLVARPPWVGADVCHGDRVVAPGAESEGGHNLVVAATWTGDEQRAFANVLRAFSARTGIGVEYVSTTRDIVEWVDARDQADCLPDVMLLPQPGLLQELARRGRLKALDTATARLVADNYQPGWQRLGRVDGDGQLYGVWFKAANKSLFWYDTKAFARAGVTPPETWGQLMDVAAKLKTADITPFAVAGGSGWTLTDWFENVYLRTAGPEKYESLASGRTRWTDETVKRALARLAEVFARTEWIAAGDKGRAGTTYEDSVEQVFKLEQAAMVFEGSFVATAIEENTKAKVGSNALFFPFPAIDGGLEDHVVAAGGDVAVMLTDNSATTQLMQFLASPEAAEPWAKEGGFISPNKKLGLQYYGDEPTRVAAASLAQATDVHYDLSDRTLPAFGGVEGEGMRGILQRFLARPSEIDRTADDLEAAFQAAVQSSNRRGP